MTVLGPTKDPAHLKAAAAAAAAAVAAMPGALPGLNCISMVKTETGGIEGCSPPPLHLGLDENYPGSGSKTRRELEDHKTTGPSSSGSDQDDPPATKRQRMDDKQRADMTVEEQRQLHRRARNRKHARETRRRKKESIEAMQQELTSLRHERALVESKQVQLISRPPSLSWTV